MLNEGRIAELSGSLVRELLEAGRSVATAESCTGGWIAKCITDIAGSSGCFGYGIVSYSNDAKAALLEVRPSSLERHGAVSEPVVKEMANGCLRRSKADYAVAVTGIAGPDGGSEEKPVGTVWFGWARRVADDIATVAEKHCFDGDRGAVRLRTVEVALRGLRESLRAHG